MKNRRSAYNSYQSGAAIAAPGKKAGTTFFMPVDTPMTRAMRRHVERMDRRLRRKIGGEVL
jgi:hypothetical protein